MKKLATKPLTEAYDAYLKAKERLCAETVLSFPAQSRVRVRLGKHFITGRVIDHSGSWQHNPGYLSVMNEATGKVRRVDATSDTNGLTKLA